jgi:predicted dehydrogenase
MSDVGVYALAVITALLGPVQAATAHKHDEDSRLGAGEGVTRIDLYEVHLVLAGGVTARVVTSFSIAADRKRSITLHGDDGSLTLDTLWDFDSPVSILPLGARAREVLAPMRPPFERCAPHAHVCDWSRSAPSLERVLTAAVRQARRANFQLAITGRRVSSGLALLAASVEAGGDRAFTGDHAAHLVEILEAIEASTSSRQEVRVCNPEPVEAKTGVGRAWCSSAPLLAVQTMKGVR